MNSRIRKIVMTAVLMAAGAAAFAASLVTEVAEPVRVGMNSTLSLIYDGQAVPQFVDLPKVDGLRWIAAGSRQSINQVNGHISRTTMCIYTFTVEKPGTYTIPAAEVRAGKQTFTSKAVTFTATQPKLVSGRSRGRSSGDGASAQEEVAIDKLLFSRMLVRPESRTFYIGEEIPVEIQVYLANDLECQVSWPEIIAGDKSSIVFKDYQKQNPNNPKFAPYRRARTEIDGRSYQVYLFNTVLRPISVGKLDLSSVTKVNVIVRGRQRHRPSSIFDDDDFFGGFFFSNARTVEHPVKSSVPQITVKPLPPRTGDAHFLGLVGEWKVDASLSAGEAKVGEAVTLTVKISGTGTMETLSAPSLELPNFRVYSPEVEKSAATDTATIKYILIPTAVGSHDLKFKFSTFNPASVKYEQFDFVKNMKVEKAAAVFSGASAGPGVIDGAADDAASLSPAPEKRGPTGVLYLKKAPYEEIRLPLWHNHIAAALLVFFLGLAFWIGVELRYLHRRYLESDPGFQRRNAARKNKAGLLNRLRAARPEALPEMNGEIAAYVNDALDLPPGSSLGESASILKEENRELADSLQTLSDASWSHASDSIVTEDFKMKLMNQLSKLVCFALIFGAVSVSAAEVSAKKADSQKNTAAVKVIDSPETAMTAYDEGNFTGAEQYYRSLKKASAPSSKLFYNIGNCLYQQGKYAQALAYYESALRIAPRDSDILENLNLTRRKLSLPEKNVLEAPADVPPYLRDLLRPDEWLLVLSIGSALIFLALGLRRSTGRSIWGSMLASGAVVMVVAFSAVLAQGVSSYDDRAAIVIVRNAPVYALPSTQALRLPDINLQSGEEVRIVETRLDWVRIRTGSAEGWVKKEDVQKLWDL